MALFQLSIVCIALIGSVVNSQMTRGISNFQDDQERLRCLGIQCPPERPRCVSQGNAPTCVAMEPLWSTNTANSNTNRLSRPALGLRSPVSSSMNQPERYPSQRNQFGFPQKEISQNPNPGMVPSFCYERFQTGRCRAYFPRYYYNKDTGSCRRFVFGGCGGNQNNFQTEQECITSCAEPAAKSKNGFDVGLGPSQPSLPSRNRPTITRPTQGNNGFAKGAPPPPPMHCLENADRGQCFGAFPRYYYNKDLKQCRSFLFGGCGGNRNNFQSVTACKQECDYFNDYTSRQNNGKNIPQGPTADILPSSDLPIIDLSQDIMDPSQGLMPDFCRLPKKVGPCRSLMPRFYYNSQTNLCEQFGFGGCLANQNNFRSERECQRECSSPKYINPNENLGRNSAWNRRLPEFNPVDSTAFRDFLNGQNVNKDVDIFNPSRSSSNFCSQPMDPGSCSRKISSYYFNTRTRTCRRFGYSGCGGNQNRFSSLQACQDSCMSIRSVV